MSIFNTKYYNGIDIRANSAYFEDVYQKNHITDEFERVGSGSEGPIVLPDWVRDNSINFRNTSVVLNGPKLDSIEADHEKLQSITSINLPALEDSIEDVDARVLTLTGTIIPAHEASLEELDTRTALNTTKITTLETNEVSRNNKIVTLENKTVSITKPNISATMIASNNSKFYIDSTGSYVFNSSPSFPTAPYLKLNPGSIEFFTSVSSSVFLDVNRIDKLARILQVTDSTWDTNFSISKPLILPGTAAIASSTGKKMMVIDPTSKVVNFTDIPSSGTLPSYLKPTFISIGDATRSLSMTNAALEFFRERNGNSEMILLDFDTLEGIIAGSTYKQPSYRLLNPTNNDMLSLTVNSGVITTTSTAQPVNFTLNNGEKVVFSPSTSTMTQNTWYGILLNGGDINKMPCYRLSVNSDSSTELPNNSDDSYTIVSKALVFNINGAGNKRYICFKIINLKNTTATDWVLPMPTLITLELLSDHFNYVPA